MGDIVATTQDPSDVSWAGPIDYKRFVELGRAILGEALSMFGPALRGVSSDSLQAAAESVAAFTAHSPRCTVPSAMGHHGAPLAVLMIQGNWRDPSMPNRYMRGAKEVPLTYLRTMVQDLADGWRPSAPRAQRPAVVAASASDSTPPPLEDDVLASFSVPKDPLLEPPSLLDSAFESTFWTFARRGSRGARPQRPRPAGRAGRAANYARAPGGARRGRCSPPQPGRRGPLAGGGTRSSYAATMRAVAP